VRIKHSADWWLSNPKNKYYQAAAKAIELTWGMKPMYIREGGTIPVTSFLEETLKAPVLHLPLGQATDRAHLQNERIRLENLLKAKDVLKNFFKEIVNTKNK